MINLIIILFQIIKKVFYDKVLCSVVSGTRTPTDTSCSTSSFCLSPTSCSLASRSGGGGELARRCRRRLGKVAAAFRPAQAGAAESGAIHCSACRSPPGLSARRGRY